MDDEKKTRENRETETSDTGGGGDRRGSGCGILTLAVYVLSGLLLWLLYFYWREYTLFILFCLLLDWWPIWLGAAFGTAVLVWL